MQLLSSRISVLYWFLVETFTIYPYILILCNNALLITNGVDTYIEFEVWLLVEVYSSHHSSRLFLYIEYTGRVWISLLVHFIPHQTGRSTL